MLVVTLGLVLQSTPVTFESPGIRLVNLIPALSKSVGVPMRVAKHMENDVVAIRTAGRPWSEVRANLAKVLNGEWRETDGEFFLGQSEAQRQAERDSRRAYMLKVLERRFAALAKNYSPTAWTEAEFNRWYSGFVQKPDPELNAASKRLALFAKRRSEPRGRLAARLLHELRPVDLIPDSLDWDTHAFSTDPFPLFQRLSIDARGAFKSFFIENQFLQDRKQDENASPNEMIAGATFQIWDEPNRNIFSFDFYDAKGFPREFFLDFEQKPTALQGLTPATMPALSKIGRFSKLGWLGVIVEPGIREAELLSKVNEFRTLLAKGSAEDPLGMFGGADWVQYASERGAPMVAFLADDDSQIPDLGSLPVDRGPIRVDANGWMLGSHSDLHLARRHRADRGVFASVGPYALKTPLGGKFFGLQGILDRSRLGWLVSRARLDWISGLNSSDFEFEEGELGAEYKSDEAIYLALFLGSMTNDEQQRLVRSGRLSLANIGPEAQECFRSFIYGDTMLTARLDDRVKGVAFANLHRDITMASRASDESGFVVTYDGGVRTKAIGYTEEDFAWDLFSGELKQKPEEVMVQSASRTRLELTMRKQAKEAIGVLYSDWRPQGAPARLTPATLGRLKKMYDEMSKEVPPVAVPVRPGTR